ncbi:MAG: hypothetical protein M3N43_13570 [Actinomycetota bacterium]|nr:hypothetical protein [Actinomycetota bacterium]
MSLGDTGPALHAFFRPTARVEAQLDRAIRRISGVPGEWSGDGLDRSSRAVVEGVEVPLSWTAGDWSQLGLFRLRRGHRDVLSPSRIYALFESLCEAVGAQIGRSAASDGSGLVQVRELSGAIETLDWFMYLGPELAGRRSGVLKAAPFFKARWTASGAFSGIAYRDPMDMDDRGIVSAALGLPWSLDGRR